MDANKILGDTSTSAFGKKKKKPEFVNSQTVDYQKSINLNPKDISDGVSFRARNQYGGYDGSKLSKNTSRQQVAVSQDGSSLNIGSIAKRVDLMN